jgi:hypothetical protein
MSVTHATGRHYRMLDVNVTISGTDAVIDAMHSRLRYFAGSQGGGQELSFHFETRTDGEPHHIERPRAGGRPLCPSKSDGFDTEYFPDEDRLYASYEDRVRLVCDPLRNRASISIAQPEQDNLWIATHPMFVLALFELLKRRRRFNVHAAALSVGGRAILLAGHSGSGKSTLALASCRAGFGFLSDDYVFLVPGERRVRVLGFPEEVDICADATRWFPELARALTPNKRQGWAKHQVRVEDVWNVKPVSEAAPALLVFPRVTDSPSSRIEPLDARDAIAELASNIQFTRPDLAQAHFDILGDLVRSSACYRLSTGRDLESVPDALRALVNQRCDGPAVPKNA